MLICAVFLMMTLTELVHGNHISLCNRNSFDSYVQEHCLTHFFQNMENSGYQESCPWPATKWSYVMLRNCVENVANMTWCPEPSLKDEIFLAVHHKYFSLCPYREDPPLTIQIMLIVPGIIATFFLSILWAQMTT